MLLEEGLTMAGTTARLRAGDREIDTPRTVHVHGYRMTYRQAGHGPRIVLLVHGLADSSRSWRRVATALAARGGVTVIAPDLLGTPGSAAPDAFDYTLGAHATLLRDVLIALGHPRATLVGHSLGGGIALAFAWQFPELVERLVLVASGGVGREVGPAVRVLALPGAGIGLAALTSRPVRAAVRRAGRRVAAVRVVGQRLDDLAAPGARRATLVLMRSLLDRRGQRACGLDRFALLADFPMLITWGDRDSVIPVAHAHAAAAAAPHAEVHVFPGAGHLLQLERPDALAERISTFLTTADPARAAAATWRPVILGEAA